MHASTGGGIVVGVDGSAASETALAWSWEEAKLDGSPLTVVLAVPLYPAIGGTALVATPEAEAEMMLREALAHTRVPAAGVTLAVRFAAPVPGLQNEARQHEAAMLVVGRRGAGRLTHLVLGSVANGLAQDPAVPLVVVPTRLPAAGSGEERIVVGVDGSLQSLAALRWAVGEAAKRGCQVDAILAWSLPHMELAPFLPPTHDNLPALRRRARAVLDAEMRLLDPDDVKNVVPRLKKGDPAGVLLAESQGAAMVVVGTRGLGAIRQRVLGSTSHALLHRCAAPLVIVPSPGGGPEGAHAGEPGTADATSATGAVS